jgi:hypothetical protein
MPEIFDKINDATKKQSVESIAKKTGLSLDLSVIIHDMAPTHGEEAVTNAIKTAMQGVRADTLKGKQGQDNAALKIELSEKIDKLYADWEKAGAEGRMADAIRLKNRLNDATQKLKALA